MQKLGLVLEGGGVKGAFQWGALTAISEAGFTFMGVTGTSIGAINGALYAQGGTEHMKKFWEKIDTGTVVDLDEELIEKFRRRDLDIATLRKTVRTALPLHKLLEHSEEKAREFFVNYISETELRNSEVDYGLIAYNLSSFQGEELMKEDIPEGRLFLYICASATYPIYPPLAIDGKRYIDGGVYDNVPVNLLARHGYDKILIVRTNPEEKRIKRKFERADLDIYSLAPAADLGRGMAFSAEKVAQLYKLGYDFALEALNGKLGEFLRGAVCE